MKPEEAIEILGEVKELDDSIYAYSPAYMDAINIAIEALKEVQQYREIGTVEECREAVEKQKPKNPKDSLKINPVIDGNGAYVDADIAVYLLCPNCGEMVGIDENVDKFCRECGQAILQESEDD